MVQFFNKITTFQRLALSPSSGDKGKGKREVILAGGSKGNVMHHRQNPLDVFGLNTLCPRSVNIGETKHQLIGLK
jgi:hypothetical protein